MINLSNRLLSCWRMTNDDWDNAFDFFVTESVFGKDLGLKWEILIECVSWKIFESEYF